MSKRKEQTDELVELAKALEDFLVVFKANTLPTKDGGREIDFYGIESLNDKYKFLTQLVNEAYLATVPEEKVVVNETGDLLYCRPKDFDDKNQRAIISQIYRICRGFQPLNSVHRKPKSQKDRLKSKDPIGPFFDGQVFPAQDIAYLENAAVMLRRIVGVEDTNKPLPDRLKRCAKRFRALPDKQSQSQIESQSEPQKNPKLTDWWTIHAGDWRIIYAGIYVRQVLRIGGFKEHENQLLEAYWACKSLPLSNDSYKSLWEELIKILRARANMPYTSDYLKTFAEDCRLVADALDAEVQAVEGAAGADAGTTEDTKEAFAKRKVKEYRRKLIKKLTQQQKELIQKAEDARLQLKESFKKRPAAPMFLPATPAGERSKPMSKSKMMAALDIDSYKTFNAWAKDKEMKPAGNRQTFTIRLDILDTATRQKLEKA